MNLLNRYGLLLLLCSLFFSVDSYGKGLGTEKEIISVKEQDLHRIYQKIRCLVCQGQSINESKAKMAESMRNFIKKSLLSGKSETETIDYLVARYGDYILLDPPFKVSSYVLWILPFVILFISLFGGIYFLNVRRFEQIEEPEIEMREKEKRLVKLLLNKYKK